MKKVLRAFASVLLLVLVSFGVYHTLQGDVMQIVTTLVLCAAGGMLGGMLS